MLKLQEYGKLRKKIMFQFLDPVDYRSQRKLLFLFLLNLLLFIRHSIANRCSRSSLMWFQGIFNLDTSSKPLLIFSIRKAKEALISAAPAIPGYRGDNVKLLKDNCYMRGQEKSQPVTAGGEVLFSFCPWAFAFSYWGFLFLLPPRLPSLFFQPWRRT